MRKLLFFTLILTMASIAGFFYFHNQKQNLPIALPQGDVCDPETLAC